MEKVKGVNLSQGKKSEGNSAKYLSTEGYARREITATTSIKLIAKGNQFP